MMNSIRKALIVGGGNIRIIPIFFLISISSTLKAWAGSFPEKFNVQTFTCKETWGAKGCEPHNITADLYVPKTSEKVPLVILQHGSSGVSNAVLAKVELLIKNKYSVAVIDGFSSRGISKSHFDYVAAASKGGNGRTMTLDALSTMKALERDKRIDVERTAIVGFSQGGLISYWAKSQTFLNIHATPLLGSFIMPKLVVSMYGCNSEFNESFNFNHLAIEIMIGDKDPTLKKCIEFKNRLSQFGLGPEIKINILPNAEHSFDEKYPSKLWGKNQDTASCYFILKSDGSVENPIIGRKYHKGEYNYAVGAHDCTKLGERAGNNGNPHIGDMPLISSLDAHLRQK